jgi:hypothetical protein
MSSGRKNKSYSSENITYLSGSTTVLANPAFQWTAHHTTCAGLPSASLQHHSTNYVSRHFKLVQPWRQS